MPSQTFTNGELAAGRTEIHDEQRSNSAPTKRSQVLMDMATSWYDMGTLKLPQHLQKYIDLLCKKINNSSTFKVM